MDRAKATVVLMALDTSGANRRYKQRDFTSSAHRNIERYQSLKLILAMPKIPAFDRREASCRRSTIALFRPEFAPWRASAAERDNIGKQTIQSNL